MASDDRKVDIQTNDSPENKPAYHGTVPSGEDEFEAEAEFQARMAGLERQKPAETKPEKDEQQK